MNEFKFSVPNTWQLKQVKIETFTVLQISTTENLENLVAPRLEIQPR